MQSTVAGGEGLRRRVESMSRKGSQIPSGDPSGWGQACKRQTADERGPCGGFRALSGQAGRRARPASVVQHAPTRSFCPEEQPPGPPAPSSPPASRANCLAALYCMRRMRQEWHSCTHPSCRSVCDWRLAFMTLSLRRPKETNSSPKCQLGSASH